MLSQEIYDSWNAQTLADLKTLLDNINGPHIPSAVKSSAFRTSVLHTIDTRRTRTAKKRSTDIDSSESNCFWCSCFRKESNKDRLLWEQSDCKSITSFENLCCSSTRCFTKSVSSVKALVQKLSYWDSIKPGTDGLSVIGGYTWILSFACQHLIDSPRDKFSMQACLVDVKEKYQELAQAGELFIELAESFHENCHHMRMDALAILKQLTKRWSIKDENNPLNVRTEQVRTIPRPRKRVGPGLESTFDVDEDDDVFSVKWSPLTVYFKKSSSDHIKTFGRLHPEERITVFNRFLQYTLDQVEMAAEDLSLVVNHISAIDLDNDKQLHGRALTSAMLRFSKSNNVPRVITEKDLKRAVLMLNEFWYSLDVLHENVYILLRLVQETRDIIRTCYVYTDIFYKWHLPSYDSFIPTAGRKGSKQSGGSTTMQAKEILHKLGTQKRLSETASIVSLMDFSSSIYQTVVQEIPVQCDGMTLRLRSHELDPSEEPLGLVSGIVDKRKSSIHVDLHGKKSHSGGK